MSDPRHVLEQYLQIRSETLLRQTVVHYQTHIRSLLDFLDQHYPELDSLADLRRTPHVEGWLQSLASANPPFTKGTLDQFIRHVRRFLEDIRAWEWPDCPPSRLILPADIPKRDRPPRPPRPPRPRKPRTPRRQPLDPSNAFHQILKRYLDIRGATLRPGTLDHYRLHGLGLINFLQSHFPDLDSFAKLQRLHIEAWLRMLAGAQPPYRNSTRRECIRNVRRFLEDIQDWAWSGSPPTDLIRRDDFPPPQRYLPKPLPPDADVDLMEGLENEGSLLSLGLLLARRTGLRVGELRRLDLECLTETPEGRFSIRVPLGKLRTEREVPIDEETAALVRSIREKRGTPPPTSDPETARPLHLLLCSPMGLLLSRNAFGRKLKKVAAVRGIAHNVHPHRLRHTYATELIRNGLSLPAVMRLLGHTNLKMTLRYVEVTNDDLGRDYLRAMERARHRYAQLKSVASQDPRGLSEPDKVGDAFDRLVACVQAVRFAHPDPVRRKKFQRFVERLRRVQGELPGLLQ